MKHPISIQVSDLKKQLGHTQALKGVSLNFEHGKMHGIIGPEGAGKTTLMRCILGLLKPDSGTVSFIQQNKSFTLSRFRNYVTYMPQTQSLYPDLSIDEHLDFFKELYQLDENEYLKKRKELLEITHLTKFTNRLASQLSGGMYKKLGLMCALLRSPEVMLLDEPTNGVDPISRREFWDLLYRLLDQKILILVSTAYMDEAERCSIVHLLDNGERVAEGEPRTLLQEQGVNSFDALFLKYQKSLITINKIKPKKISKEF